ncbi:MAG: RagB/SusD family nutrient uptake outer membrane protein [Bacteroidales bacterium]|nr:RagB/SusD family nutrient uptake outer membrane protein [Bacteroidales bacterium]
MKKISIFLSVVMLGLGLASCQDQLDIPQKSVLDYGAYYAEAGDTEADQLIAAVYSNYYSAVMGIEHNILLDILSDDHHVGGGGVSDNANQFRNAGNFIMTSSESCPRVMYQGIYRVIYYCNSIIEKIEGDSPEIARVKAEAKFFRAICMFEAARLWGTPPFVDHLLSSDEYELGNGDTKEIIEWCLTNLQEAADALPAVSGAGNHKAFGPRVSKHAALAYKGKVALWYGQKFKDNAILGQAAPALKAVIDSHNYELVSDMSILFRPAGDFCSEYVFEHNAGENDGHPGSSQNDLRPTWMGLRTENIVLPSHVQGGGWGWDSVSGEFGRFLTKHDGLDGPRFKAWIATYDQIMDMDYAPGMTPGVRASGYYDNEGYFRLKGIIYKADLYDVPGFWRYTFTNDPYMRYSEVLLMYAEVCQLTGQDQAGGLAALNQVRQRAGLPALGSMTMQDIKDERRAELWGEQERFFDLVRWGDAATALKDKNKTWYTFYGYKPGTKEWDVRPEKGWSEGWDSKYELMPFPYAQLAANPNLKQNPGW